MKKNIHLYIFLAIMTVFTAVYFFGAFQISYAFNYDEAKASYDAKIKLIEKGAKLYAENDESIFLSGDTVYVTVADLIAKNYLVADNENGDYKDPTSEVKTLNDVKVRISKKENNIEVKILT